MTILSYKTIFGLTFSAISENLLESFFHKFFTSPKNCEFGHFLARLAKIGQNENFYKKSGRAIFFTLIVPQLHAKFQKNRQSGFRDQFVRSEHPNIRTSEHTKVKPQNQSLSLVQYYYYHTTVFEQKINISMPSRKTEHPADMV